MRRISKKICEIYNSEGLYQYFRTQDIYRIKRQYLTEQSQSANTKWYLVTTSPTIFSLQSPHTRRLN